VVEARAKDFVAGRAALTVIDPSIRACDEGSPMDDCPTPWDFCCDPPEEIAGGTATVELRENGRVLAEDLQGFHGLDHLDTVVVRGTLEKDEVGNMTVVADALHVIERGDAGAH
jgi:hypothetical protein